MKVSTLYLDTSVIGGYFDAQFSVATRELWKLASHGRYHFLSSDPVLKELQKAPPDVRQLFTQTFTDLADILEYTPEMDQLAQAYMKAKVVPAKYAEDSSHVAVCSAAKIDYLVSWNFKHLVNVHREAGFNAVNLMHGYGPVRIISPMELIYGP
ncbi:MAG: PIN domain protein [Verrucomicrobiae bacterium]|nr:PIN domain protein [Verrucomicrobiae bacterium]